MKILITGASSYVGARIYFDLKDKYTLKGTYFSNQLSKDFIQLDLTDESSVEGFFDQHKTDVIVHAANYPSKRFAEGNEENFINVNKQATQVLVKSANNIGARFIFISSQAAVNPSNIYGKLKIESEEIVKTTKAGYLIIRPSAVVGFSPNTKNKSIFNNILRCLDENRQDEFDTSWKLQPTYLGHISQIINHTIEYSIWNKTLSIYIDEPASQYQIAMDVLKPFGKSVVPIDLGRKIPPGVEDLSYIEEYDLSPKTYAEMIDAMVKEIKNRDKFTL